MVRINGEKDEYIDC